VYLACLFASPQVALPYTPAPWFELFDVESEEEICEVSRLLLELYRRWVGDIEWLRDGSGSGGGGGTASLPRASVWRRAAELKLPLTREEVRSLLKVQ